MKNQLAKTMKMNDTLLDGLKLYGLQTDIFFLFVNFFLFVHYLRELNFDLVFFCIPEVKNDPIRKKKLNKHSAETCSCVTVVT